MLTIPPTPVVMLVFIQNAMVSGYVFSAAVDGTLT